MNPTRRAALLGVLGLAMCVAELRGLASSLSLTQYVRRAWRAPDDLPHDNVSAVLHGRDGYLWIGTVQGLARFDGRRSVVFDRANTPEIANDWIRGLAEDRSGRLWIATLGGGLVSRLDGVFRRWGAAEGLPSDIVLAVHVDLRDRLWVGTSGAGFVVLEDGRFVRPPGTEAFAGAIVKDFLEDRDGTLWVGTDRGAVRLTEAGPQLVGLPEGLPDDHVMAFAETPEGVWIATESGGLVRWRDGEVSVLGVAEGLAYERVWSLAADRDGNLWIGTDGGGLQRWSGGRLATLSTRQGFANDFVWAIEEDGEGSVWVGTNGGGLVRLTDPSVVSVGEPEGLPTDFVWSATRTSAGVLLLGTEDRGLLVQDRATGTWSELTPSLDGNARTILERASGEILVAGQGGLFRVVAAGTERIPMAGADTATVSDLLEASDGTLWIGTNDSGLWRWSPGADRPDPIAGVGPSTSVSSLLEGPGGEIWIGALGGLHRWRRGVLETWTAVQGLPSSYVTSLAFGPDGELWVGTRGGLARFDEAGLGTVTEAAGLDDNAVVALVADNEGGLWLGSNRGLARVPFTQLDDVLEGRRATVAPLVLGREDGLRTLEINGGGSSAWKDPDGRLWFATRRGVVAVDPRALGRPRAAPRVVVEELVADGTTRRGPDAWRLPSGTRRLEIRFTALSFRALDRLRLRHRLLPFDETWQESSPERVAHYTNLPPGTYRFEAIASPDGETWDGQVAAAELEIVPSLTQTASFRIAALVLFLLAGPVVYVVRVRQLEARHARLERVVAERTAEVAAANAQLAKLAREDGLTGLANRRAFDEALGAEWRRCARGGSPLGLLLIDTDLFKAFNDHAGHLAGDDCLRSVAAELARAHQRAGEMVARYGGEEIAVLLPAASLDEALLAGERARARVEALGIPHPTSPVAPVVTVSVGVGWMEPLPAGPALPEDLVAAADRALYRAKRQGRNRVVGNPSEDWCPANAGKEPSGTADGSRAS